jgi:hypothetical protein
MVCTATATVRDIFEKTLQMKMVLKLVGGEINMNLSSLAYRLLLPDMT